MLLRPEDSIHHQNNIGSDIIMALDDVISSVEVNTERFEIATYRTLRWYDRCIAAHQNPTTQNLFPIVQGGLDVSSGGLRDKCLVGLKHRDDVTPGYAIGGLAGGESKDDFWKVVHHCCKILPDLKPRYLMGVGYPLDLVICTALGVDMYDCVYPTRTARFGVALVDEAFPGTLRLKNADCGREDDRVIMEGCMCQACCDLLDDDEEEEDTQNNNTRKRRKGYSRARLHTMMKSGNPLAVQLITNHNLAYMKKLTGDMRNAILEGKYDEFVRGFISRHFPGGSDDLEVPGWVKDALHAAGIEL